MKFATIVGLVGTLAHVLAAPAVDVNEVRDTLKVAVDYSIQEFPDVGASQVAALSNGDTITIVYTASNLEKEDVSIVGVGGSFRDPLDNKIKTNLTSGAIGPFTLASGQSETFSQKIPLNLIPDNYVFAPEVYVTYQDQLKALSPRTQLTTVSDVPISFFNLQLLFLEIILVASFAGLAYVAYQIWGKKYISGVAPVAPKKKAVSPTAVASSADWLPETHTKKRSKKAN